MASGKAKKWQNENIPKLMGKEYRMFGEGTYISNFIKNYVFIIKDISHINYTKS